MVAMWIAISRLSSIALISSRAVLLRPPSNVGCDLECTPPNSNDGEGISRGSAIVDGDVRSVMNSGSDLDDDGILR